MLADDAHYAEWNTQLAWLGPPASPGATLHLRLAAEGADPYEFKPLVTAWERERRFTWLAITGVLSPLMKRLPMMAGAPAGFRKMNDELRRRAEAP